MSDFLSVPTRCSGEQARHPLLTEPVGLSHSLGRGLTEERDGADQLLDALLGDLG